MHDQARAAVARLAAFHGLADQRDLAVCDLGGRNINGSLRDLFTTGDWTAVDAEDGPGVDVIADARTWRPVRRYGLVLCTEVFEHVAAWPDVLHTAAQCLNDKGVVIATCASDRRPPHGMSGGPWPEPGEHYANVPPAALAAVLADEFRQFGMEYNWPPGDLYCWARR